jgi:hypothetical protein
MKKVSSAFLKKSAQKTFAAFGRGTLEPPVLPGRKSFFGYFFSKKSNFS